MVYYRKYRPQTLDELIGQEHIKQTLLKSFQENRLSHAYLFSGPRGIGKTSTARILAKMVNCESKGEHIPCNKCSSCLSIIDGSNLDIIEIDAASNRGIDDIRDLKEKIKLSPIHSKKKVYIIDEVHMLTTEAFNALLKTLEEPPEHVLFILATTEVHKIPATILSRVQRLDFKEASIENLIVYLKKSAQSEKIKIDEDTILLLAKKAEGSFRDAIKLLDQLSSQGSEITSQTVEEIIKSGSFEDQLNLLEKIARSDANKSLNLTLKQIESGVNIKEYILSLMDTLRNLLLMKYNLTDKVKQSFSPQRYILLEDLSKLYEADQIIQVLDQLQQALEKMKFASIPSLPLEIAVIQSALLLSPQNTQSVKIKEVFDKIDSSTIPQGNTVLNNEAIKEENLTEVTTDITNQTVDSSEIQVLKDKWNYILETIKSFNYSLEALLRAAALKEYIDKKIILEVPYSFHQRIIETPRNREMLESILSDVLAKPVKVYCQIGTRPIRAEDIANIELAADDDIIKAASEIFNSDIN